MPDKRTTPETKVCEICKTVYERPDYSRDSAWEARRFCSRKCMYAWRRLPRPVCACGCGEKTVNPHSSYRQGHNPWGEERKVFTRYARNGKTRWYLLIRGGGSGIKTVPWARVVMEGMVGRPLRSGEVVHHINGDSEDDRPENLQLFASNAEHIKVEYENASHLRHSPAWKAAREQGECRQGSRLGRT